MYKHSAFIYADFLYSGGWWFFDKNKFDFEDTCCWAFLFVSFSPLSIHMRDETRSFQKRNLLRKCLFFLLLGFHYSLLQSVLSVTYWSPVNNCSNFLPTCQLFFLFQQTALPSLILCGSGCNQLVLFSFKLQNTSPENAVRWFGQKRNVG